MQNAPEPSPRKPFPWACDCDECYESRKARPPSAEELAKFADLIAERTKRGQRPESRNPKDVLEAYVPGKKFHQG